MPERQDLPRVLVLGQPFERETGGGITLCNLFTGWPRDKVACAAVAGHELCHDSCDEFYLLGSDEIRWVWPLSLAGGRDTRGSGRHTTEGAMRGDHGNTCPPRSAPTSPGRAALRGVLSRIGAYDVVRSMHLSVPLRDWIRAFRPDLVYSQLSDLPVMTLVEEVLREERVPLAVHVMDDWPSTMYRSGALAPVARRKAETLFESLLARSGSRMAISGAMAREYERRYGHRFAHIHNAIDLAERDRLAELHSGRYPRGGASGLTVLYAGRVGRANAATLLLVAHAVTALSREGGDVRLRVHTPDAAAAEALSGLPGVSVLSPVPYEHVPALLSSADVLLLPLDFDEDSARFAGLSMPTKVPEYLAAGRAVLTVAPPASAAAAAAKSGGWSLVVDAPDETAVRSALLALAGDPAEREAMGDRGRLLAAREHDAANVRAAFAEELTRAASMPAPAERAGAR